MVASSMELKAKGVCLFTHTYRVCHLLDFLEQSEDNTGIRINNPDGLPPLTNWRPNLCHPHHFMPDALSGTTLPIYHGLGQAPNMLACTPGGYEMWLKIKAKFGHIV